ncbi:MAG TPA: hypothetical protein VFJ16_27070, partial [Longimicrobium sp.]|nr:hypothetical protein [Longimicrobium sp.]
REVAAHRGAGGKEAMMGHDETKLIPPSDPGSGTPGDGAGRRDVVGGSGVYPASAGHAPPGAVPRTQAEWGQGDRGAAGFDDAGSSGLFFYPAQLPHEDAQVPHDDAQATEPAEDAPTAQAKRGELPHVDEIAARRGMEWGGW